MAIVYPCPECGKKARLADSEAGLETVCAACGCQFQVPGSPADAMPQAMPADAGVNGVAGPAPATSAAPASASVSEILPVDGNSQAVPPTAAPIPEPSQRSRISAQAWTVVAVISLMVLLGLGLGVRQKWMATLRVNDREMAEKLHSDARRLLSDNQLSAAKNKYLELASFLAPRALHDPFCKKLAADVSIEDQRVDRLLAASIAPVTVARPRPDVAVAESQPLKPATTSPAPPPPSAASETATTAPVSLSPALNTPSTTSNLLPRSPEPKASGRPPVQPVVLATDPLTDEQIGESIQRGVDFLIKEFDPKQFELREGLLRRDGMHDGADSLCVYALMQCAQAIDDSRLNLKGPFIMGCIEAMKNLNLNTFGTYSHGLRSTALALNNRKEDEKALKNDVGWLLTAHDHGAYSYGPTKGRWDNSNSQYGLLGVWSGAEAGVEVPTAYWQEVEKHWKECQEPDGQWGYSERREGGRLTMTCAGIASMFVCHDYLDAPKAGSAVGREPFSPSLKKGLAWLEKGDNSTAGIRAGGDGNWGYALYGVERVGLASGFKFFGRHNWYPELARRVIAAQSPDGSWRDPINTAYALLFLSRGRHPVIMNKLRFDGYWANRPRDASNLARYASVQLERPINWQVVPLDHSWTDWTDSPILSLSSHQPPKLSDSDVDKIRNFVLAGGMLYVQADGDSQVMTPFAKELGHRLFPMYEMQDVLPNHPLFTAVHKPDTRPLLKMVSNESRILMLFSPTDISKRWQMREQHGKAGKPVFQLGLDMFIYAAGRRDLRNRLQSNVIEPIASTPSTTVHVARVKYAGAWDPEPYAWTRFSRWFQKSTSYALDVQPVAMADLDPVKTPFASLTGTVAYNPSALEIDAVKKYVEAGGVLFIDTTGGTGLFADSVRSTLFAQAFPKSNPALIPPLHPLLQPGLPGMTDVSHPRLRPYAHERLGMSASQLDIFAAGKGHVIFTPLNVTSGLLNTGTWGILGYEAGYCQSLMKNAIFWMMDGQKE